MYGHLCRKEYSFYVRMAWKKFCKKCLDKKKDNNFKFWFELTVGNVVQNSPNSTVMGEKLITRLQANAGLTFKIEN